MSLDVLKDIIGSIPSKQPRLDKNVSFATSQSQFVIYANLIYSSHWFQFSLNCRFLKTIIVPHNTYL